MPESIFTGQSGECLEHSMVITNFVAMVGSQIKDSACRVLSNNVKYKWAENNNNPVIPDVSINCDTKNRRATAFMGVPRFIMEVLSDATEHIERTEKMELYQSVEVMEYWLVDWCKKKVEIYVLTPIEDTLDDSKYVLYKTVTESNKGELGLYFFPSIQVDFDELFDV